MYFGMERGHLRSCKEKNLWNLMVGLRNNFGEEIFRNHREWESLRRRRMFETFGKEGDLSQWSDIHHHRRHVEVDNVKKRLHIIFLNLLDVVTTVTWKSKTALKP